MLLAIDIGNTNSVFAVFDGERLQGKWRLSSDARRTADEYAILLKELMALSGLVLKDISAVITSSVVPQTQFAIRQLCENYFRCKPLVVGQEGARMDIAIKTDSPQEVGADRLVNAIAAYSRYQQACIIIDFGTATTFDVVAGNGDYLGGMIAPGINLSLDALHRAAAKLPEVNIQKPEKVIGKSTVAAMQSGIYYGYLGLIEGNIMRIKSELAEGEVKVIATGGLAPLFAKATNVIDETDVELTLTGLMEIYMRNRGDNRRVYH